ncbi:hypothetical protein ACWKWU_02390 [Chitinophaga lutea]
MKWIYAISLLLFSGPLCAQERSFSVDAPDGKATGAIQTSPSKLPFLLITGIAFPDECKRGQPKRRFRDVLETIRDAAAYQVKLLGETAPAGYLVHNCRQYTWTYLADTTDTRQVLTTFYQQNFSQYPHTIILQADTSHDVHQLQLLPLLTGRQAQLPPLPEIRL